MSSALVPLLSATLFLNATLLFSVQPMFGKMILPLLGGTPTVWNTAMLFYQVALLLGYGYAHLSSRWLRPSIQAGLHLALMAAALAALPIALPAGWTPPVDSDPVAWLLALLTVAVGIPFTVLSAGAPMIQRWYATTRRPDADNPYFLYGISNAGSLVALLAYPLLLEPNLVLAQQSDVWTWGFLALFVLMAGAGFLCWRERAPMGGPGPALAEAAPSSTDWRRRLHWAVLAFAPSSLMLGVTGHITTDIAAVPLIWVIPLALYLVTFMIAFSRRPAIPHGVAVWLQPFLVLPTALLLSAGWDGRALPLGVVIGLHLGAFFLSALVCHGELARLRPRASELTGFYFWISFGGALGGVFNTLIAPQLFTTILEYPLALALACALRPGVSGGPEWKPADAVTVAIVGGLALIGSGMISRHLALGLFPIAGSCLVLFSLRRRMPAFGVGMTVLMLAGLLMPPATPPLYSGRNFFGSLTVLDRPEQHLRVLLHGTTTHGSQSLDPAYHREPLAYYTRGGALGDIFAEADRRGIGREVGVIGLGAGAVACTAAPNRHITFFEINPAVSAIARDPRYFTFLADCDSNAEIIHGDGRLTLRGSKDGGFDLLILDAFSSDAIPIHLLTREAIALYRDKLALGGLLVLHLSNRYLDLAPVVGAAARDLGLAALIGISPGGILPLGALPYDEAHYVALARDPADFGTLPNQPHWKPLFVPAAQTSWSDDYSNLFAVMRRPWTAAQRAAE